LAKREHALTRAAQSLSQVGELPVKAVAEIELAPAMRELGAALRKATAAIQGAKVHHQDTFDDLRSTEHLEPDGQSEDRVRRAIVRDALKSVESMKQDHQHQVSGDFSSAGLAYFAIAVGLDDPPSAKPIRGGDPLSAAAVFRDDNVKRWQRILGAARKRGQGT
jgi:hypothetical protein